MNDSPVGCQSAPCSSRSEGRDLVFLLTMQNHGGYTYFDFREKYGAPTPFTNQYSAATEKVAANFCYLLTYGKDGVKGSHRILENSAEELRAAMLRHMGDVIAADDDLSFVDRPASRDRVQRCRFARAVAADDGYEIALFKVQVDSRECGFCIYRAGVECLFNADKLKHFSVPPRRWIFSVLLLLCS